MASDGLRVNIEYKNNEYPYKFNDFTAYDMLNNYTIKNASGEFNFPFVRTYPTQYYLVNCTGTCDKDFLGHNDGKTLENSTSGMLGNVTVSDSYFTMFYPNPYEEESKRVFDFRRSPFFVEA